MIQCWVNQSAVQKGHPDTVYRNIGNGQEELLVKKCLTDGIFFQTFNKQRHTLRKISQLNYGECPAAKSPGIPRKKIFVP